MQCMQIVLPGALPGAAAGTELVKHLPAVAPRLVKWLENSRGTALSADPTQTFCTPLEAWLLAQHGFEKEPTQKLGAGLGPLLAAPHIADADNHPVWLIELVHLAAAREGAMLQPARKLALTQEESRALFETAASLFEGTEFGVDFLTPSHWRVHLPSSYQPVCATPELVSRSNVTDWWSQETEGRAWRRLANELQMAWFDHAINQERAAAEQIPVNGVWLFGGGKRAQLTRQTADDRRQIHDALFPFAQTADWGGWLNALQKLDETVLASFDNQPQPELILAGHDCVVRYQPGQPLWQRLLPGSRHTWKKWWINPQ